MKYASVCSGVEAASLAWMPMGWEAVWFSEIEPFPCAVLKERFPNVPNLGDMTKINVETRENGDQIFTNGNGAAVTVPGGVELLVGGTPCQSFSVAGKREGLEGASGLAKSFIELLGAMRPRWFVWENVPGCLSAKNKRTGTYDFNFLLAAFADCGYSLCWRILDAQYVRVDGYPRAVPQRRRRVFVIGHIGADWQYPASVLFEPDSLFRDTPPRRVKGKGFTGNIENRAGMADRTWEYFRKAELGQFRKSEISGTILCHEGISPDSFVIESQYGNIAGTLEARHDSSPCADRVQNIVFSIGNGQAADASIMLKEACQTLNLMHDQQAVRCYENHAQDSRVKVSNEVCQHLTARTGTSGGNLPLVQECYPINSMVLGKEAKEGDRQTTRIGENTDPSPTLQSAHHHSVAVTGNNFGFVRRLLPVETERLMGFPDHWTRIPWRGKPAEDCPDGPRYKACGNSMCVNVMRWIGMRIELAERKKTEND